MWDVTIQGARDETLINKNGDGYDSTRQRPKIETTFRITIAETLRSKLRYNVKRPSRHYHNYDMMNLLFLTTFLI